VLELTQ